MASLPRQSTMTRNILRVFDSVNSADAIKWASWYPDMTRVCASIAQMANVPLANVAAAMAWLSPQQSVAANVAMTLELFEAIADGGDPYRITFSQYPAMVDNAIAAAYGELDSLNFEDANGKVRPARKVRTFYRNLCGDTELVTVDRHAVAIAINQNDKARNGRFVTVAQPNGRAYLAVQAAYQSAARLRGVSPRVMQSVVWCARRGSGD